MVHSEFLVASTQKLLQKTADKMELELK